jgi:nucleoside-diphosphate-sugar epimerase
LQAKTFITTTNVSWQGDVTKIWFDNSKAKKELKWNPKVSLEDSIREIIAERKLS